MAEEQQAAVFESCSSCGGDKSCNVCAGMKEVEGQTCPTCRGSGTCQECGGTGQQLV